MALIHGGKFNTNQNGTVTLSLSILAFQGYVMEKNYRLAMRLVSYHHLALHQVVNSLSQKGTFSLFKITCNYLW